MAMMWVSLDQSGNVTGVFANKQDFTSQQLDDSDPKVQAFLNPTLTFDQLIAQMQQLAKTLAAVVEALVAAKTNNATLFNGLQPWATNQLTAAHTWIKSQGG